MRKIIILAVASAFLLSGCATIVGDETQLVQVNSNPEGALFSIKDESGKTISEGKTPQGVSLKKSDGSYFGKKTYEITFSKENYKTVTLPIKSNANGWYIGGNILVGGLIGWFAVDPFNGGMYTLSPKEANAELIAQE